MSRLREISDVASADRVGADELERVHRPLFPDGGPWPYGLEANRATLDPFPAYCHEQGVTQRRLRGEDLFPKEIAFEVRI